MPMVVYVVLIDKDIHVYPADQKLSADVLHAAGAEMRRHDEEAWDIVSPVVTARGFRIIDHRKARGT